MNAEFKLNGIIIETDRLILRPFSQSDLQDFYAYAKVEGVGEMAGWSHHENMEKTQEILNLFIEEDKTFAIVYKRNNKLIGSLGVEEYGLEEKLSEFFDYQGREIGYVLSKDYWGKGLMPEAVKSVINYCFETIGCNYLLCSCSPVNKQSARVMEKCGFQFVMDKMRTLSDGSSRISKYHVLENIAK